MKFKKMRDRPIVHLKPSAYQPMKVDKKDLAPPESNITLQDLGQAHVLAGPRYAGFQGVVAITKHKAQPKSYVTDSNLIRRKLDEVGATDIQFELVDDGIKVAGIAETAVKASGGFLQPPWDIMRHHGHWTQTLLMIREAHAEQLATCIKIAWEQAR